MRSLVGLAIGSLLAVAGCTNRSQAGACPPPGAQQITSGGGIASSSSYRLVFTIGEPTAGAAAASSGYRLQGGLTGAMGGTP
jgi:hypothetical protein